MTAYRPMRPTQRVAVSVPPFALRRALIAAVALALVTQQLPALPTPRAEPPDVLRPALLDPVARRAEPRAPKGGITPPAAQRAQIETRLADLPIAFEANRGQADPSFDFVARGRGYAFGVGAGRIVLALQRPSPSHDVAVGDVLDASRGGRGTGARIVALELVGARADARLVPLRDLPGTVNYFIGNDPAKWRSGIPTYARVRYEGVYPGIDVVHYGNGRQLEFDVVVAPGADPSVFALRVEGAERLELRDGEVILAVADGELALRAPQVYQEADGVRTPVTARYVLQGADRVAIEVDAYDAAFPLVIDPIVDYSTYLGGAGADFGLAVAVDRQGNAYVTGQTTSTGFPTTTGTFDASANGAEDVFVTKIDRAGSAVVWSTYIGGALPDFGLGIAVGGGGISYVTGRTDSSDFPTTTGAFDTTCGTDGTCNATPLSGGGTAYLPDAFVTALHPDGSVLVYSTYLGGSHDDRGLAIAVNDAGQAHVTGHTTSSNFPTTTGAFQTTFAGSTTDAFVTKLNGVGSGLVYSTYLGGSGPPAGETATAPGGLRDVGRGIALDGTGHAYVTGSTDSTNFPTTTGAFQTAHASVVNNDGSGYFDAFVTKFSPSGGVVYSTFLGGNRTDHGFAIAVDSSGQAYVTGATASTAGFPTTNGFDDSYNFGADAFLTKLNAAGAAALYSTYLGGSPQTGNSGFDEGRGVAADALGNAWVVGRTDSTNFPTAAPTQATNGGSFDAFLTRFDTKASGAASLPFSTYYGGSGAEEGLGIGMGPGGNVTITGWTSGTNLPTTTPLQLSNAGSVDVFVARFVENVLYGVESSSDGLSRVNAVTGQVSFIGRLDADVTKLTTPVAMAVRPSDRTIFVWNNSDGNTNETSVTTGVPLTVDRCTGLATKVAPNAAPQGILGALAFSPQGTLYGVGGELYTISTGTGVKTLVGSLGLSVAAADFDPVTGTLYGVELTPGGSTTPPRLVTINTATGAATVVATLGTDVGRIGSIVFGPRGGLIGSAFGGTLGNILFDLDKTTGSVQNVRSVTGGFAPQGLGFSGPCGDTTAPAWLSGAALTTFRVGPKLVGFSWPTAQDNVGVTSYKVFQNGVLRATLGGSITSYRAGTLTSNTAYTFLVQACDAAGNCGTGPSLSITTPIGLDNYTWSKAYPLTPGVPVSEHLFLQGLSGWFKFAVKPDQRVEVTLTNLPADYDLLLFKDIAAAAAATTSLPVQNAQLLDSALIDSALVDSALIDSALIDSSLIDSALIDSALIDSALIDSALIDSALIDSALIDSSLIDSALIDSALIDSALIREASSAAARRSVLARSANVGTANERIVRFTFDRTGDFYVRVRGKGGAFSLAAPFQVQVNVQAGLCEGIAAIQTPSGGTVLTGVAGSYKRVIVWDASRIVGAPAEKAALETKLAAYAARPEVAGVVVRVDQDSRVNAAHVQADANVACPYAKNLVAAEIKRIIDSYRDLNPVEDVVLVGPDSAVPFWRHVDPPFGTERDYVPPTRPDSASEAALRKGLFLSQDRYGARVTIERLGYTLPLQDIGVSRVIETAAEVSAQLDAYALLTGGQIPISASPSALVTGYDFLTDFAQALQQELQAGLGGTAVVDATLIGDTWTTNGLKAKILGQRYDFQSLGGHFSAFSTIGPDYDPATKLRSTEVLNSSVNMEWSIAASPGCHLAFNVPDGDGISLVTPEPDWAQVAARKKFILVAGTGYQYGETELVEYSERLYLAFWKQLRTGTGAVSTSAALLGAKTAYRAKPLSADLHIKALLEATHFGLPVLVNMPGQRITASSATSIVSQVMAYTSGPGSTLSLSRADTGSLAFTLANNTVSVRLPGAATDTTATYLTGGDGFVANPLEPVLPLELRNVSVPNTLLRGVGFRGGSFTDTAGVLPLTSTPGTELGSAMVPFVSDVLYPVRPWGVNSLDGLTGGPVRLFVTPAQHRSGTPGSTSVVRRQLNGVSFRLFYSAYTGAAATAGAHAIEAVTSALAGNSAAFSVIVAGDSRVGAQEVWITYTATSGPFAGLWQSLDLTRLSTGLAPGREIWTGSLGLPAGQTAGDVRYFVQVANGLGIVSMTTNGGAYFRLGPPPTPTATSVVLQSPTTSVSGPFGATVSASAILTSAGSAVANARVSFDLGGVRVPATTDATGTAAATVKLDRLPGAYALRALFDGTDTLARSQSAGVTVTVTKQGTAITLTPGSSASGQYSDPAAPILVATLREASTRALALREETIYWVVSGNDASSTPRYFAAADITNANGQAVLRIDATPLPAGTYSVVAHFSGSIPQATGPALVLTHRLYQPTTATGSLTVTAEDATVTYTGDTTVAVGSVLNAAATVAQSADGTPGDITKTQVRFDVKDGGVVVATATVPVPASGQVSASFSNLATNVYAVEVTLLGGGFFAAPVASVLVAVYDPSGGFVTGGGWIDSPAGACQLSAVCAGATGRANFGFVSKYQPGATTPTGQTQFQFKAGGLSFHSSSYDWLVVAGARAQFKGSGKINGAGDYGFLLTAIDGQVSGGGGSDKFRIKIWDKTTGTVVYDNQLGSADDSDPTTVIQGGSIVIHKG